MNRLLQVRGEGDAVRGWFCREMKCLMDAADLSMENKSVLLSVGDVVAR